MRTWLSCQKSLYRRRMYQTSGSPAASPAWPLGTHSTRKRYWTRLQDARKRRHLGVSFASLKYNLSRRSTYSFSLPPVIASILILGMAIDGIVSVGSGMELAFAVPPLAGQEGGLSLVESTARASRTTLA